MTDVSFLPLLRIKITTETPEGRNSLNTQRTMLRVYKIKKESENAVSIFFCFCGRSVTPLRTERLEGEMLLSNIFMSRRVALLS